MIYCTSKENNDIRAAVTLRVVQSEEQAVELVYDVNGDSYIDAADALAYLRHIADIEKSDGDIQADALEILIQAAKLEN